MATVLCWLGNITLKDRWQTALSEHRFVDGGGRAAVMQAPPSILIIEANVTLLKKLSTDPDWQPILRRHRVLWADPAPTDESGLNALQAGCVGYCHLYCHPEQLRQIIAVLAAGELWVGRDLMLRLLSAVQKQLPTVNTEAMAELTEREQSVAKLVVEGLANKEIAERLAITVRTVKAHLTTIFEKLGVRDRLQLVARLRQ
ncbi:response regulator transcription factor [Permianibacter sp. IMCC34836]|uniref:response regulator transcription factor n=1 Tax=Permianibacter fluminis TaxID=2738515 RepID=UPI001554BBA0|nr:response regulator transcription factor [Permianibacter fluminis]NQD38889.1 response regulator transcription factor [Permianibacter fluminis]